MSSKCATENKEKQYLYYLLGNKKIVTVLLLRGSEHDDRISPEFRARYPEGPFICLLKVKDGDCIGCYSKTELDRKYLTIKEGD